MVRVSLDVGGREHYGRTSFVHGHALCQRLDDAELGWSTEVFFLLVI